MAKQSADQRKLSEPRYARHIHALILHKNPSDGDRAAVFNLHLSLHMFRVDGRAGNGLRTDAILGDIDIQHHMTVRRDIRRNFQFQSSAPELHARYARTDFSLIRQFSACSTSAFTRFGVTTRGLDNIRPPPSASSALSSNASTRLAPTPNNVHPTVAAFSPSGPAGKS